MIKTRGYDYDYYECCYYYDYDEYDDDDDDYYYYYYYNYYYNYYYPIAGDLCRAWTFWQHRAEGAPQHVLVAMPPGNKNTHK